MKQEIQDKNMQERQAYASPKVKVITTSVQRVICISDLQSAQNEGYEEGSTDGWY